MDQRPGQFDPDGVREHPESAIAVVGMSCRFAGARGIEEYWDLLSNGREAIRTYSNEELAAEGVSPALLRNRDYVRRGAPLEDMECFDASLFDLTPRDAAIMDPQHRHFLECTWEAFENAGHTPQRFDGVIGVFGGTGHNAYMPYNLLTNPKLVQDVGLFLLRHTGNDKDFLTTRVSYLFDLKGPSINVQTACSTSLVAVHMAAQSLLNGECDMAIAGGASIELPHRHGYLYEEGEILSPDGHCRPFDAGSQGTVFGSGVAVVALRRLADAVDAGDHIYAVLRGSAINNDGAGKVSYLAPSVDGQAKVIAEALAMADVDAGAISYIEAHGSGTPVGDPIEIAALTEAFRQSTDSVGHCAVGSVKGNIGHTDTAAGAAGLIKVALSLHHEQLPASLNFKAPNPAIAFEGSPFRVQDNSTAWARAGGQPRRAGVSSLGVGGTNAHVVLEQAPPRPQSGPASRRRHLLLCTAKSPAVADANARALGAFLAHNPQTNVADAAFTLTIGRQHLLHRRFVLARTAEDAAQGLCGLTGQGAPAFACISDRPVAFMFCGAGPQHADMARDLYRHEPLFRAEVDRALDMLDQIGPNDVARWLFPRDEDRARARAEMERPSIALPALFIIQTALARLWMSVGVQPSAMIGHSSGEYAAAHLSGVIDLEAGLRIVSARGRLFETIHDGGMLSVPLAEADLLPLLPDELSIAAINAPGLCVVSGPATAIAQFDEELARRGIETQVVRISVAAHSPMLDPVLPEFRAIMQRIDLHAPQIPFVSNLTGAWATAKDVTDPEYWVRHLRETVRFTDGLGRLLDDQERVLLEVGPGRGMGSLARQHPGRGKQQPVLSSMRHPDQDAQDDTVWLETLGHLWAAGVSVDWDSFWRGEKRLRIPLPTYQFDRQRQWYDPGAQLTIAKGSGHCAERSEDVADWQYEPVWSRSYLPSGGGSHGPALVFEDRPGLGRAIAALLREMGRDVVTLKSGRRFARLATDVFSVNPANSADYALLFESLAADERLPSEIYHCCLVTGTGKRQPGTAALLDCGFHSLVAMSRELARHLGDEQVKIAVLTDRVQRIGDERDLMPVKATVFGAASVIPTEYPNLHIQCIDLSLPNQCPLRAIAALADAVVSETAVDSNHNVVAYRGEERWVREFSKIPAGQTGRKASEPHPRSDATYLVTGGLGGLGLAVARHLAETPGVRIALLGRSSLPPRESWAELLASRSIGAALENRIRKVMALEACGARVEVIAADVADLRAVKRSIAQITSRLGPIHGVFHTAGVLADELIESKTRGGMEAVLHPKVHGTLALERALKDEPPDFLMLFSSISAFAGLPGQADYAAANSFLDSFAQSRWGTGETRVSAVDWSPWREVGMAAQLASSGGVAALPLDLPDSGSIDHPFLDKLHIISADETVVSSTLSPTQHWLLAEHRLEGTGALIPGTGFLELVRAAHSLTNPGLVTLADVTFLTPFAVPDDGARELRVHLKRRVEEEWRFAILGRSVGCDTQDWVEHVTGAALVSTVLAVPERLDIASLEQRCVVQAEREASSPALQFGPRWENVRRTALGKGEAVLRLCIDPAFHGDLDRILLHPALMDFATAGAQSLIPGYIAGKDLFAPLSYGRIVLHAPLPSSIVSHIRCRQSGPRSDLMAVFDVTLADGDGRVLAEVTEFTMMRVREGGLSPNPVDPVVAALGNRSPVPTDGTVAILPEEGLRVIADVLEGPARPQVIVSPSDLDDALARLRAPYQIGRRENPSDDGDSSGDLPQTVMEHVIAGLWTDLLGVRRVHRDDNFFDLGGHSLLAVQFTNRLRKKTGKVLPLAALLDTSTVASLARELDPEGAEQAPTSEIEELQAVRRDIVTLSAGGDDTPLFFIHDGLGETLLYRGLALKLDPDRPVYGIEPLRNPSGGYAHTRIDEMAANYVERVRTVQTHGPYLLAGLCAGGVIAFEMARQFQRAGEIVAFVGIIDAADVAAAKRPFHIARARLDRVRALLGDEKIINLVPALARKAVNAVRWEIETRIAVARDRRSVEKLRTANEVAGESAKPLFAEPSISFLKLYEVAHTLHRPEGLFTGGKVVLFKATSGNGEVDDVPYQDVYSDVALGWGRRIEDEIALVTVPGGHCSALQEPHVATLAPLFQAALDGATSSRAPSPPIIAEALHDHDTVAAE